MQYVSAQETLLHAVCQCTGHTAACSMSVFRTHCCMQYVSAQETLLHAVRQSPPFSFGCLALSGTALCLLKQPIPQHAQRVVFT